MKGIILKPWLKLPVFIIIILLACNNGALKNRESQQSSSHDNIKEESFPKLEVVTLPENKTEFKYMDLPEFKVDRKDTISFDSIQFIFENQLLTSITKFPVRLKPEYENKRPRRSNLEARIYKNGQTSEQVFTFRFLSDIEPKKYSYQVIRTFPHDRAAYTQGLAYENGYIYESNGLRGESTLRQLQIGTGQPIQSFTLAPEIFAEGLTIWQDNLIQISWQNRTGFVYDKKSFRLLKTFTYNTEGWGLTHDNKSLIMSDGSNKLYFIDPLSYSVVAEIEVYDNKGPVEKLNELEYIEGEIYANIYQTDLIARIEPETGRVLAYIDLSKLLNSADYEAGTDVLNGIAYDAGSKRMFVTGKKWPKLFEIKLK
ncbi:MAG: glutaminyl-peptide cyclotransferase [Bacteroidales bacterium]